MIYLDNAATTKISSSVFDAMLPWLKEGYGNASSIYKLGRDSARAVITARETCAAALGADPHEIIFTSGGSEGDNWAIKSSVSAFFLKNPAGTAHIVTSAFEHHAVLHVVETLAKNNPHIHVTYLPVYNDGFVRPADLDAAFSDTSKGTPVLATIMFANNEIGTIQPIEELAAVAKRHGALFHTDAVQIIGNADIDVHALGADMLSMSSHKIHGPKGIGLIYIKKGVRLPNLIEGGAQERGLRGGTENVAGIVGLSKALSEAADGVAEKVEKLTKLRTKIYDSVIQIPKSRLNGSLENRLAGSLNFSFEAIEGEALLLNLDLAGIAASSGSACTSGSLDPSHVLLAIGLPTEIAHGSLRITMSKYTTEEEIDVLLEKLPGIIAKIRSMSPLWQE